MEQVEERGQFALRGGLLDVFPATEERAVRVDMFDVEIESLRWFSTFTQRSLEQAQGVEIAPAAELAQEHRADSVLAEAALGARGGTEGGAAQGGRGPVRASLAELNARTAELVESLTEPDELPQEGEGSGTSASGEVASLRDAMRKLWADHVVWTRQYIVAAVAGAPDAQAAAGRLLANQEDIGNAIVPLYGEEAGAKLTALLKDHILIAVDLVDAAVKGNKRAFARHDRRWDDNADEIAAFLASANPNWPEEDVRDLLAQHLTLTKGEAVARLQQDWDADVAAFDDIFTEILTMADALTDGIVAQFPERFGGNGVHADGGRQQGSPVQAEPRSTGGKTRFRSSPGNG